MKILAIADEIAKQYDMYYRPGMLDEYDLIISCGDLPASYLEFLVTMAKCPLLYVRGNHDDSYLTSPPQGCICIEDQIYEYEGIRFLGLGGSSRYRPDGRNMYTEEQMRCRIRRLWLKLRKSKGFDVLVTHAPARGYGDLDTLPHQGFACFLELIDRYQPKVMLHGHVHLNYGYRISDEARRGDTRILNAWQARVIEMG